MTEGFYTTAAGEYHEPAVVIMSVLVALTVYALLHYFVYARVAHGLGLSSPGRVGLTIGLGLAALSFIAAQAFSSASWVAPLLLAGAIWLGVLSIAATLFFTEWTLSLILHERRRQITISALGVLALLTSYTIVNGSRLPVVKNVTIALEKMPANVSGFTLVQLSDLHLGRLVSLERLGWIVDHVNDLSPDLVVITGDVIDRDIWQEEAFGQQLKRIKARYAVLAIPGNHDYYAGYERFLEIARRSNITVLRNERLVFAGAIQVAGLDEPAGRSFAEGGPNLEKALAGNDPDRPTILLAHRPDGFLRAVARKIDLQLSGHTHAGQIPPLEELYWVIYPYSSGYYEKDGSRLYTSCGTGTWGPPMRLLSRNEIVRFTLVRKPSA